MNGPVRRRQGLAFLAGAAALAGLVALGPLAFTWTPLLVGVAYAAAAVLGGRSGPYWATAAVIGAWGLGVAVVAEARPDVDPAAAYLLAVGLGALGAGLAQRRGLAVGVLEVGGALVAAGGLFLLARHVEALARAEAYAVALALVGAWNLSGIPGRRAIGRSSSR